ASQQWWKALLKPRFAMPVAFATAAMIAVMVGIQHRPDQSVIPGGEQVMRSRQVAVISPIGDLREPARNLVWRAVPGAASYRVTIFEALLTQLWTATVQDSNTAVPDATVQK